MAIPIVRLPGDRMAHSLGVPLEYMRMDDDVAGLGAIYGGSMSFMPPEEMQMESIRSTGEVPNIPMRGLIRGFDYMPPEMGVRAIHKIVPQETLIPGDKRVNNAPDTMQVTKIKITDARNDWTDSYGGEAADAAGWTDDEYGAPIYDRSDFFGAAGGGGMYETLITGGLSDSELAPMVAKKIAQIDRLEAKLPSTASNKKISSDPYLSTREKLFIGLLVSSGVVLGLTWLKNR